MTSYNLNRIRPLVKSYVLSPTITLQPSTRRILFFRILPLIGTLTVWPFSSSTSKTALGKASVMTPFTRTKSLYSFSFGSLLVLLRIITFEVLAQASLKMNHQNHHFQTVVPYQLLPVLNLLQLLQVLPEISLHP